MTRKATIALCASMPFFAIAGACLGQILALGYATWLAQITAEITALF